MTNPTKPCLPAADGEPVDPLDRYASIEGLDFAHGLAMVRGNRKKYAQILALFAGFHLPDLTRIPLMLSNQDLVSLKQLAHTIKGSAAMIGAKGVADAAARLHAVIARTATQAEIESAGIDLSKQLSSLIEEIRDASDAA